MLLPILLCRPILPARQLLSGPCPCHACTGPTELKLLLLSGKTEALWISYTLLGTVGTCNFGDKEGIV